VHHIDGEKNILADQLSRLEIIPTPAQLAEGKKLIEPTEVTDDEEEDEAYSWTKSSLVYMTRMYGNVLSVISTYPSQNTLKITL
jgi:hypothetical protein